MNLSWDVGNKLVPVVHKTAAPATTDVAYRVPTLWLDDTANVAYLLVDVTSGVATWKQLQTNIANMTTATDPLANAATTAAIVAAYSGVIITTTGAGNSQALASPSVTTAGRTFMVVNNDTSTHSIPIVANSVTFVLTPGEGQCFLWDGSAWGPTDLGITEIPVLTTQGGTGRSTGTTAYALVATGTTATGAHQTLANGATTEVLVGGGASALPVWTTATGTGAPVRATSPILVTPALGTPASGDLKNCTGATTTTKGVTVYSGTTKALAGTDTASAMTPADVAAANAVTVREPNQGVNMTYAASGSSGIAVADNNNINFGTGNFTLVWKGSLPDWTPSADTNILRKWLNPAGYNLQINTNGTVGIYNNLAFSSSSVATNFADSTVHEIVCVVTYGVVTSTVSFYADGIMLGSQVSFSSVNITTSAVLYVNGTVAVRNASTTHHAYTYNRALTAAEVLDLYRNGIAEADKYGSQTALVINATDSMAADNTANWTEAGGVLSFDTDHYVLTANATGEASLKIACAGLTVGKKYRWQIKIKDGDEAGRVCTPYIRDNADATTIATGTAGTSTGTFTYVKVEWTATEATNLVKLVITSITDTKTIFFDDSEVYRIGATLALEHEGIQPAGAASQWLDSSTNKLNAILPAAGATNTRKIDLGRYPWSTAMTDDTTWTSILPAGFVLEKVIFNNSTANACELRLGTSAGGTQMAATITIAASTFTTATIDKVVSLTADTTLYLSDTGAGWNSASLTATLFFRRFN